ncbi:MAG: ATP-binding protein [Pseudomonadota bacterium]
MTEAPTLHMLCGKIASGKSTLAAQLSRQPATVLITEDDWLGALFPGEMSSLSDFARCSGRLRTIMAPHITDLLQAGVSVVLDFHANTVAARAWMRGVCETAQAAHQLHVLNVPDEVCLARLRGRNAKGDHPFTVTEEQFHQFTKHFVPPSESEGFTLVMHDAPA